MIAAVHQHMDELVREHDLEVARASLRERGVSNTRKRAGASSRTSSAFAISTPHCARICAPLRTAERIVSGV